jgi:serine/threonine-protein kinase
MTPDGRSVDDWIGRAIERIPLSDAALARARAFARAGHGVLQTILRVDRDAGEIWLEAPHGEPARALTRAQIADAHDALARLHDQGTVHGAIDATHVLVDEDGDVTILFGEDAPKTATVDLDRIALARLGAAGAP